VKRLVKVPANASLTSLAGSMRRRGASQGAIYAALAEENKKCNPPLNDEDIRKISKSIVRYEPLPKPATNGIFGAKPEKFFNRTDSGNAEFLAYKFGDEIRFCFEYDRWLIFDGKRWKFDNSNYIYEFAKKTMRAAHVSFDGNDEAQKFYRSSESKAKLAAIVFLAQTLLPIAPAELDSDDWFLNVQNGVINLRNGELLPHDPKYFMTKICKVDYVQKAPIGLWQESLAKIMPDQNTRDFIQRFAGYSLTGNTREEKFLVLHGEGGTGKGTVTETLADLLGDYADTLSTDVLLQSRNSTSGNEPTPELAKLPGVRLLLASETGQGRLLDEAKVKALTGGDRIPCRKLRCDPFTYKPNFKLWLSTNHAPRVRGTDEGVWRRIRIVPFDQQFRDGINRDNAVKELLHNNDHLKTVLSWAVEGCLEWQRQGLVEPDVVLKTTADFRNDCDITEHFFADECEIGPIYEAPVKMFYHAFKDWCADNGHIAGSSTTFTRMMESKKYIKTKKKYGWVWPGVRLAKV
jgi:putative DNA primase/helicase